MVPRIVFLLGVLATPLSGAEEQQAPAVLLQLDGRVTNPDELDYAKLPRLSGSHTVVCPTTKELPFQLHDYVIHYDGQFWCMFSHGPEVEDMPTQFVSYATSRDGLEWSSPKPLTPRPSDPYAYIARDFWLRDGELLALVAHFRGRGAFGVNKELRLEAFAWDATSGEWRFKSPLFDDAINNYAPQKLSDGEWLLTRRDSRFNVFMLAGGNRSLDDWQSWPVVQRRQLPPFSPDEPVWWQLPDGRLHAVFRDNGGSQRLYQSFSTDQGRTWSLPRITNFPNATSKCFPLRLRNGKWLLISNANPRVNRREMHISVSSDGLVFHRMLRLEIPSTKATTFQYPHALEHDGNLWIVFSQKKMQTELLRVSLADLE